MGIFLRTLAILNLFLAVTVGMPPPDHFVVSVTASSDISKPNILLQFDPDEPSHIFNSVPFPAFESALWGALDRVGDRFILLEIASLQIYDARNLSHIDSLDINDISIQLPTAMHYDHITGLVWLMWTGNGQVENQWCAISNATSFTCFSFPGQFEEIIGSAYVVRVSLIRIF